MAFKYVRIVDAILVLSALATGALAWKRTVAAPESGPAVKPIQVDNWRQELSFGRRIGAASAPYRLVVWTDYQCPACRQTEIELGRLKARMGDSLAIAYRYFPLSAHHLAFAAATVAECARRQGQFSSMHETLFAARLQGDTLPLDSLLERTPAVDGTQLRACLGSKEIAAIVQTDVDRGDSLGLRGTPYLQIGRKLSLGGLPALDLEQQLRAAMR